MTSIAPPKILPDTWLDGIDFDDDELHIVPHLTPTRALCGVAVAPGKGCPADEVRESDICEECRRIAAEEEIEL